MSSIYLTDGDGRVTGIMTVADVYQYKGFRFEFHHFCGPTKVNKDGEIAKRQGRKFFKVIDEWIKLPIRRKEETRI